VSGSDLHVEELPPASGEGPLVVLVHGSMDRLRSFARLAARLQDCQVIGYDRRGYARSRAAEPLASSVADHAADLVDVLDGRPALVFGHSYGADVVLAVAQERPDLIRSAIVYEAPMPWFEWWQGGASPLFAGGVDAVDAGDAALGFVRRMIGEERYGRMPERFRAELRKDGPAFRAEMRSLRDDPPPFVPAQIGVRVLVVRGSEALERQVRGCDFLVSELPEAELAVIDGAGHGGHLSHPGVLADLIHAELARPARAALQ
jgi:pimeloyl-ACP methyl ester carboxylesterase